jgi:O-antigen/teichoic acid export membrane protein
MRTKKSIRNVLVMFGSQALTLALSFVSRTVFIKTLGAEYLGVNGLFYNLLNTLSLAELGMGTALAYALYKPIAEDDHPQINSLLRFYRKCYTRIGLAITGIGILLLPFLPYLIKGTVTVPIHLDAVYLCFLANSVITYFVAHRRAIIDCSQDKYLTSAIDFATNTSVALLQIVSLWLFRDYMLFLYIKIIGTVLASVLSYTIAGKKFPYIKEKATEISASVRKKIWSDVSAMFLHKFGYVVTFGTDFIIISAFVGLTEVGVYSNYALIANTVMTFGSMFIVGADASVGNAIATLSKEELSVVFGRISFLLFCVAGFATVCLLNLVEPFIELWVGPGYLLHFPVLAVLSANHFVQQNRGLVLAFKQNSGIFRQDKYKPLIEVVFNLGLSIYLAQKLGVLGVVIGTLATNVCVNAWVEAYLTYKYVLKEPLWRYAKIYTMHIVAVSAAIALSFWVNASVENFALKCVASVASFALVYFLFFGRTNEFRYCMELGKKILKRNPGGRQ